MLGGHLLLMRMRSDWQVNLSFIIIIVMIKTASLSDCKGFDVVDLLPVDLDGGGDPGHA